MRLALVWQLLKSGQHAVRNSICAGRHDQSALGATMSRADVVVLSRKWTVTGNGRGPPVRTITCNSIHVLRNPVSPSPSPDQLNPEPLIKLQAAPLPASPCKRSVSHVNINAATALGRLCGANAHDSSAKVPPRRGAIICNIEVAG